MRPDEVTATIDQAIAGRSGALQSLDVFLDGARSTNDFEAINEILDPLAARARTGDDAPLGLLIGFIDNHRLAVPTVRKVLIDERQVEDACQEALLGVVRGIHGFEGRSRFTTWLYPIALNAARMQIRRDMRAPEPAGERLPPIDPGLRRMSSMVASRDAIDEAISLLPAAYRDVLVLREVQQRSYEEISTQLGIEMGTVKSRLTRARGRVADMLRVD